MSVDKEFEQRNAEYLTDLAASLAYEEHMELADEMGMSVYEWESYMGSEGTPDE